MACERSCSVSMSDRCVMSHADSFVIMLGGAGAARLTKGHCVVAALQFMNV